MRSPGRLALGLAGAAIALYQGCSSADTEEPADPDAEVAYTTDGLCDGLPRVDLETPPGVCVGIVMKGFVFPRGLAQLPSGDVVVADMGGWATNKGTVWRLRKEGGVYQRTLLLSAIDKPSGVQVNRKDGLVYVGTPIDIFRFDPEQSPRPRLTQVVKNLPGDGRHPLKQFVFDGVDPDVIYANMGSATDVCEKNAAFAKPCYEEALDRSGIRKYVMTGADRLAPTYTMLARGLRNSMALAVHPTSNVLLQGENSRDSINKRAPELTDQEGDLPHEELNVIEPGAHYGFPYCYDNNVPNPEYRSGDCAGYRTPVLLLPGHAAPLGMKYYGGPMLPADYKGQLLVGFHGYRDNGHRLVMVPVDDRGVPAGQPLDVIRGWEKTAKHPLGAPVDVVVAKDGSVWLTEDKNGTVLRVFYDRLRGNGKPMPPRAIVRPAASPEEAARCAALPMKTAAFSVVQRDVIDNACVSCHGAGPGFPGNLALLRCDDVGNAKRLLAARRGNTPALVVPGNEASELVLRLKGQGYPQMPAGGVSPEALDEVLSWIRGGAQVPPP